MFGLIVRVLTLHACGRTRCVPQQHHYTKDVKDASYESGEECSATRGLAPSVAFTALQLCGLGLCK